MPMYSPSLSRYPHGAVPSAGPPSGPSGPHRPVPAGSAGLRAYAAAAGDEDDELLSADELVKTLQPPPSAGARARPGPVPAHVSAAAGGPHSHPRHRAGPGARAAVLTPHDYFQPPPRLPRDAAPWSPPDRPRPPPDPMAELPPETSRARAYQLMLAHQRQAQLHTQLQLRQYHQQHQQHEPFLSQPHPQHRGLVADGSLAHAEAHGMAQAQLRRRGGGRHGVEHAHRIHRELQPPPAAPARLAAARRRVASPASPDFDPQFDLLPLDPAGMDLYDADDLHLPLSLAGPSALDASDELLGRPASSERRLGRPVVAQGRRGPASPAAAAMGQSRASVGRPERDAESGRTRPPPPEPPQGAAKRAKTQASGKAAAKRSAKAAKPAVERKAAEPTKAEGEAGGEKGEKVEKGEAAPAETKRRCGRKSMNYSSEQKRERNRAAVKKCRQRQALKLEYLQHKAEVLQGENQALSDMLVQNVELDEAKRRSLTRGIQMDILLKIKEIFTQSLPKDFVLDADSIWDLNSVLAVSMPSRCYYGIESIKDFWRTSLRMRNKGKIRSFWAWLFRLPPGDRFSEFRIEPFSPTSSLYFISWTTKSDPPLAGSMVIMFGHGHRVTLHVECFGWLIWRYLLTNEPFPEPPME